MPFLPTKSIITQKKKEKKEEVIVVIRDYYLFYLLHTVVYDAVFSVSSSSTIPILYG
jgi:hypothetical protein